MANHVTDSLSAILAVGHGGEIGVRNALPWRLKSDLRFFKRTTLDNIIIMGSRTAESVGGYLKNRQNIILSKQIPSHSENSECHFASSVVDVLTLRSRFPGKDAYVIGGAMTYAAFAPFIDRYLVTIVEGRFPEADAFFDDGLFGNLDDWACERVEVDRIDSPDADEYEFTVMEMRHRHPDRIVAARNKLISDRRHLQPFPDKIASNEVTNSGSALDRILSFA